MQEKYRLGLVSVSFRGNTPEEILEAMRSAGLCCVEWGSDVHAPCNDKDRLELLVDLQKKYGIVCSSYGTYFRFGVTPIAELEGYLSAAKQLGTDVVRVWCGNKSGADMTSEEKKALLAECFEAARLAEKHDIKLCLECHNGSFTERPEDTLELLNTINSPCFKTYWQPSQFVSVEQNIESAIKLAPHTEHIHVFNWEGNDKFPLNDGASKWRQYLSVFGEGHSLLLEFMPDGKIETLMQEALALRSIVGEK